MVLQCFRLLHMFLKFFRFSCRELKPALSAAMEAGNPLPARLLSGRGGRSPTGTHQGLLLRGCQISDPESQTLAA